MWPVDLLRKLKLPKTWGLYQAIHVVDGTTFEMYLANMQSMFIDMVTEADMVLFNRCTPDMPMGRLEAVHPGGEPYVQRSSLRTRRGEGVRGGR